MKPLDVTFRLHNVKDQIERWLKGFEIFCEKLWNSPFSKNWGSGCKLLYFTKFWKDKEKNYSYCRGQQLMSCFLNLPEVLEIPVSSSCCTAMTFTAQLESCRRAYGSQLLCNVYLASWRAVSLSCWWTNDFCMLYLQCSVSITVPLLIVYFNVKATEVVETAWIVPTPSSVQFSTNFLLHVPRLPYDLNHLLKAYTFLWVTDGKRFNWVHRIRLFNLLFISCLWIIIISW